MKNITLSVDDAVLAAVRRYASERNTTVNGLVRDYLTQLATQTDRVAKARRRLKELSEEATMDRGNWTWNREELYERSGMLPRHEHPSLRSFQEPGGPGEEEDRD
jgi:hypothetical protein